MDEFWNCGKDSQRSRKAIQLRGFTLALGWYLRYLACVSIQLAPDLYGFAALGPSLEHKIGPSSKKRRLSHWQNTCSPESKAARKLCEYIPIESAINQLPTSCETRPSSWDLSIKINTRRNQLNAEHIYFRQIIASVGAVISDHGRLIQLDFIFWVLHKWLSRNSAVIRKKRESVHYIKHCFRTM